MTDTVFSFSGSTRTFAVLGHPVAHSLSPAMHNPALRAMGLDAVYLAYDVDPDHLLDVLGSMGDMGFAGVNLTIPHKEVAFQGVKRLASTARRAGSVNTIVFHENGELEGHSTDGYGLHRALEEAFGRAFEGQHVLVLGCGGAGRAAALQAADEGAASVRLANRTQERADKLALEMRERCPDLTVEVCGSWPPAAEETRSADVILQSTSQGMKKDDPPMLEPGCFREGQGFLDMTYVLKVTPTMRAAEQGGAEAVNGLGMLLHQGVRSLEIWTGRDDVPVEVMREAMRSHVYGEAD